MTFQILIKVSFVLKFNIFVNKMLGPIVKKFLEFYLIKLKESSFALEKSGHRTGQIFTIHSRVLGHLS